MQLVMARARFRAVIFVQENSFVVVTQLTLTTTTTTTLQRQQHDEATKVTPGRGPIKSFIVSVQSEEESSLSLYPCQT